MPHFARRALQVREQRAATQQEPTPAVSDASAWPETCNDRDRKTCRDADGRCPATRVPWCRRSRSRRRGPGSSPPRRAVRTAIGPAPAAREACRCASDSKTEPSTPTSSPHTAALASAETIAHSPALRLEPPCPREQAFEQAWYTLTLVLKIHPPSQTLHERKSQNLEKKKKKKKKKKIFSTAFLSLSFISNFPILYLQ